HREGTSVAGEFLDRLVDPAGRNGGVQALQSSAKVSAKHHIARAVAAERAPWEGLAIPIDCLPAECLEERCGCGFQREFRVGCVCSAHDPIALSGWSNAAEILAAERSSRMPGSSSRTHRSHRSLTWSMRSPADALS